MNYQSVARFGAQAWRVAAGAAVIAALALSAPSQALAVAHGKLTIDQPTGTAAVTDTIDVFLTLTLDADSAPLIRAAGPGPFGGPNFTSGGVTAEDLMGAGFDPSKPFTQVIASSFLGCGINPLVFNCGPGSLYSVQVFSPFGAPGAASLAVGTPLSFKFATLTPSDPLGVPPAIYSQQFGLGFSVMGKDYDGNNLRRFFGIASVCSDCTFSRLVGLPGGPAPAPEPASWALMIGGFGLTGALLRRRRLAA